LRLPPVDPPGFAVWRAHASRLADGLSAIHADPSGGSGIAWVFAQSTRRAEVAPVADRPKAEANAARAVTHRWEHPVAVPSGAKTGTKGCGGGAATPGFAKRRWTVRFLPSIPKRLRSIPKRKYRCTRATRQSIRPRLPHRSLPRSPPGRYRTLAYSPSAARSTVAVSARTLTRTR
jgi:hypothetical protein